MNYPELVFQKAISNNAGKIVKAMKAHNIKSFTNELTDVSGNVYELSVKVKTSN